MGEKKNRILINSIILFIICFLSLLSLQLYQDYNYYSVYPKEELLEFFSMKDTLLWDISQAFRWSTLQLIIVVPVCLLLEKINIKNISKILIAILVTSVISFIYVILNLTITF